MELGNLSDNRHYILPPGADGPDPNPNCAVNNGQLSDRTLIVRNLAMAGVIPHEVPSRYNGGQETSDTNGQSKKFKHLASLGCCTLCVIVFIVVIFFVRKHF